MRATTAVYEQVGFAIQHITQRTSKVFCLLNVFKYRSPLDHNSNGWIDVQRGGHRFMSNDSQIWGVAERDGRSSSFARIYIFEAKMALGRRPRQGRSTKTQSNRLESKHQR